MTSVCLATYNGERFIKQQIDSILCQLNENDELIISDDGSTDGTLEIIRSYNDSRIKIFHHIKNPVYANVKHSKGFYYASENFENALKQAKGDYIFLSDQDDVWIDSRKEKMLNALKEFDCVMCNFEVIDSDNNVTNNKYYSKSPISESILQNVIASKFIGCCMAFNRNVLNYALPFPKFLIGHDFWIGCIANNKFQFTFLEESLHKYRRTGNNVSASTEGSNNSCFYKIQYRFKFFIQLLKRFKEKK